MPDLVLYILLHFLHVNYSVQILSFHLKIWMEVDKPFKYKPRKFFLNPLCVCGYGGNCLIIYITTLNELLFEVLHVYMYSTNNYLQKAKHF